MPESISNCVSQSNSYLTSRPSPINASSYRKLSLIALTSCVSSPLGTSRQDPHSGYGQDAVDTTDQLGDPGQVRGRQDTDAIKLGLGKVWLMDNLQSCGREVSADWPGRGQSPRLHQRSSRWTEAVGAWGGGLCKPQGGPQRGAGRRVT